MEQTIDTRFVAFGLGDCRQRLVDDQREAMRMKQGRTLLQYVVRTVDGDRNDRQTKHGCDRESSLLETVHVTVGRTGAFWEDDHRSAALESAESLTYGVDDARSAVLVDPDLSGAVAGATDERKLLDALAEHPSEILVEEAEEQEDVVGALVIGYEDVACFGVDILTAFYLDWAECKPAGEFGPDVSWPITPESSIAECASEECGQSGDYGQYEKDRHKDEPLIEEIKDVHIVFTDYR